ncbi:hypothetical protein SAMN05421829_10616 [Aromatoleum tolulyticum]|uniref:Uncharacterized protein n=1 Tax=Aromatoleum tolulyticum TaxID=34027 RepID=A0A1N6URJ2_9RHOO|nr:hypothetical protein SAMN05421829_10616 [Aromatoleum tolulyticum]
MTRDGRKEIEEQLRQLEVLQSELEDRPAGKPSDPDEVLQFMEAALRRTRGSRSWAARFERFAWRIAAPFWDLRLRAQIRLVRELGATLGWTARGTSEAILHLDDLVFARTYGCRVEASVKRAVRELANRGLLATHELRNLVSNRCLRVDAAGRVFVPTKPWLMSAAVALSLLATLVMLPILVPVLWAEAEIWRIVLGVWAVAVPYGFVCWQIQRYFVRPHRLIPRAQRVIPHLHPVR